jgi:hypothetical protein
MKEKNERRGQGAPTKGQVFQRKQGNLTISKRRKFKPHCWEPKALGLGSRKPDLCGRLLFELDASGPSLRIAFSRPHLSFLILFISHAL